MMVHAFSFVSLFSTDVNCVSHNVDLHAHVQ